MPCLLVSIILRETTLLVIVQIEEPVKLWYNLNEIILVS